MDIQYNRKRFISVMELSSSGIKTISAAPFHIKNRTDLSRFSDNRKHIFRLHNLIDNENNLDIDGFKENLLPEIIKHYRLINNSRNPQAFQIVLTGYYRELKNKEEVLAILNQSIKEKSLSRSYSISILKEADESRLPFLAWKNTASLDERIFSNEDQKKDTYLHIDIGGATTEISVTNDINDFSNTISLENEITKLVEQILDTEKLTEKILNNIILDLCSKVLDVFVDKFKRFHTIDFAVASGSAVSLQHQLLNPEVSELIPIDTLEDSIQIARIKNNHSFDSIQQKEIYYRTLLGSYVLKTLLKYAKVDSYFLNIANLRIGCIYDMMLKLRENKSPYL
ncbi:Ppx/GppA phosphatase family protein [Candidatus Ulvibacter alkanivorans]|uniref:Ppx/GppA phosphatase family protein n=1 Tax=Candidatus Ulvibacter alkanivorans TaxID=2267620 RepID=UPI000DF3DC32|nr:hypothetical protein [Candidatus Ulvibacter alkanivorans]